MIAHLMNFDDGSTRLTLLEKLDTTGAILNRKEANQAFPSGGSVALVFVSSF